MQPSYGLSVPSSEGFALYQLRVPTYILDAQLMSVIVLTATTGFAFALRFCVCVYTKYMKTSIF